MAEQTKEQLAYAKSLKNKSKGKSSSSNSAIDLAKQMASLYQKQVQPAVTALKAEADPLKQRYQDLIGQIKGNQQVAEQRQTLTTGNELAKRGLLSSGGLYQQEMTNAVNPVTQQYTGMVQNASTEQESALKDLATRIAQLQSGAATTGLGAGVSQYNTAQSLANQLAASKASSANELYKLQNIDLPSTQADIAYKNALTAKALKSNLGVNDEYE